MSKRPRVFWIVVSRRSGFAWGLCDSRREAEEAARDGDNVIIKVREIA